MTAQALSAYDTQVRADQVRLGLWMFLGTVTMLFAAFASAYIVRRSGSDWRVVALPRLLWLNTFVLALSSAALEAAQWHGARRQRRKSLAAFAVTIALGIAFLAGQVTAWRALVAAGVYLPTSPHSSFFYVLTGAHAAHVLAALAVLMWGAARLSTYAGAGRALDWATTMGVCRTFWHYLGVLWVVLLVFVSTY